ncbi:vegetative cell wall protein gp1-like [Monomorium pharaonis]|uniref:vegetative cell wall protein gp1-like n=1 Tax=Monomorium pharaonis TaxID=307658 RepID=UPI001746AC1E|nr:vegetative cell wall protein gp1-like [Monomorium pharaonis]
MSHCSMASRSELRFAMFGGDISSSSGDERDEGTAWRRRPKEPTPPSPPRERRVPRRGTFIQRSDADQRRKASFLAQLPPPPPRGRRTRRKPPEGYAAKAPPAPPSTRPAPSPSAPLRAPPPRPVATITPQRARPTAPPPASPIAPPPVAPPAPAPLPAPPTAPWPEPPTAPPSAPPHHGYHTVRPAPPFPNGTGPAPPVGYTPPVRVALPNGRVVAVPYHAAVVRLPGRPSAPPRDSASTDARPESLVPPSGTDPTTLLGARGDRPDGYKSRARSGSSTSPVLSTE